MENTANRAELCGSFVTLPSPSHENHGQRFYHFYLRVERLSGYADVLRVIAPERVLYAAELEGGDMLYVRGQVRSYNEHTPDGRRLRIFVYAEHLECRESAPLNDDAVHPPQLPPQRLPAGDRLGAHRPDDRRGRSRGSARAAGQAPEPGIYQNRRGPGRKTNRL